MSEDKNIKIARLIGLEKKSREARDKDELNFLVVNETREIKKSIDLQKEIKIITRKITNEQLNQFANIYLNKLKKNVQLNEI